MNTPPLRCSFVALGLLLLALAPSRSPAATAPATGRFLYVAVPGIRDELQYGGHGVLVFDIDHGHRFVRRIAAAGREADGRPLNVKGICASAATQRLYITTTKTIQCFDLATDRLLWEKPYDGGCDRLAITPDGKTLFVPTFERDDWHVIDALDGTVRATISPHSGAHNTIVARDGRAAYLAGLKSPVLTVADPRTNTAARTVGPFSAAIRPFTIDGRQERVYVNVNGLLGFEIGDLRSGRKLARVEITGFEVGPTKRHGCPSHGIALTPDEKEVWVADSHNSRIHVFDNTTMPPRPIATIALRDQPGWITFDIDGRLVYPSTGEVIDAQTRRIVATLTDETGTAVQSEKLIEIDFAQGAPIRVGDQFALGQRN